MNIEALEMQLAWGRGSVLECPYFTCSKPELIAILGPNGSGKSSLLRSFAGLFRPKCGNINLNNQNIYKLSAKELARNVAWLPQQIKAEWPFTVWDFVMQGRYPHIGSFKPISPKDKNVVRHALSRAGLLALANRKITELSGGELQRVYIARALAQEAGLLLLDEPLSQLDIGYQQEVLALLRELVDQGHCIIMAVHDINIALAHAERVLVLHEKKIQADGLAKQVLEPGLIKQVWNLDVQKIKNPHHTGQEAFFW